jgi:ADP-heptose:LPS heptosyltransferase
VGQGGQSFSFLLSHAPDIRKDRRGVLEYYCDLVRQIGAAITSLRTEYSIPDGSKAWVDEYLRSVDESPQQRFVAVHPGASGDYKIWPPERYAALIDFIQEDLGARVILLRGSQDGAVVAAIRQGLKSVPIVADTGSNVEHFAALLKRCALCISNDSGPRHLAVALGVPSLAFFRQHHDHEWKIYDDGPLCVTLKGELLCPACPRGKCLDRIPQDVQFGSYCTRMISVDDAITRVREMLHASGSPP